MSNASVAYLLDKAAAGERLYFDEALRIYRDASLENLGRAANSVRQMRMPGRVVTYLIDRHVNYTNVCNTNCQFCNLHRPPGHEEGFVCSHEELAELIDELIEIGGTSIVLQGGHNPDLTLDWYLDMLRWLRVTYPQIERNCFSPPEIAHIARQSGLSASEILRLLKDAGLQGIPGGGAEILDDEIRQRFSPKKQRTDSWLSIMRAAHRMGLNTTATMVIGFGESLEHRIHHLQRLRSLQDYSLREAGQGFNAFISWTLQTGSNGHSALERSASRQTYGASTEEYLRHVAVARLFLDNILHHQTHWVTQGLDVGKQSLNFGIDDFGSVLFEETFVVANRPANYLQIGEHEIGALIREAGYVPARRDTAYHLLNVFESTDSLPPSRTIRRRQRLAAGVLEHAQDDIIPLQTNLN
jgi:cyclic dehypoxanthinyl futalosine synthase